MLSRRGGGGVGGGGGGGDDGGGGRGGKGITVGSVEAEEITDGVAFEAQSVDHPGDYPNMGVCSLCCSA